MTDLVMMDATALGDAIRTKRVSCVEVMTATLDHIARLNPEVNAIVNLRDARRADGRSPRPRRRHRARPLSRRAARLPAGDQGSRARQGHADDDGLRRCCELRGARRQHHGRAHAQRRRRSSSAAPTRRNSASARTPTIPSTAQRATPTTKQAAPAAAAAAPRSRWRCACCPSPTAATTAAACATPPAGTTSSRCAPASAACRRHTRDVWLPSMGVLGPMARNVPDLALLLDVQAGYDARAPLSLDGKLDLVSFA